MSVSDAARLAYTKLTEFSAFTGTDLEFTEDDVEEYIAGLCKLGQRMTGARAERIARVIHLAA